MLVPSAGPVGDRCYNSSLLVLITPMCRSQEVMLARELRQAYIDFFGERGHLHVERAPLEPRDALGNPDESTLFTSAGMQQFKPYFTGEATPPHTRITTVQPCLRTNDIDSVGDYAHCTLFEMLGNFSFGDYFKAEVIPWTWE